MVDRASKFLFACPLPSKDAVGVICKRLELLLTFEMPLSIRSDAWGEFTVQIDGEFFVPMAKSVDRLRSHQSPSCSGSGRKGGGGGFQEVLSEL